jgi:hypothetical protein
MVGVHAFPAMNCGAIKQLSLREILKINGLNLIINFYNSFIKPVETKFLLKGGNDLKPHNSLWGK